MKKCIFCKIAKDEIDSAKIWEDKEFLAILDTNPNTKGMTLLLTKRHYGSYAFDMPEKVFQKFMLASRKVAKILERGLNVSRIAIVIEGVGIDHVHIKLYPLHGVRKEFKEMWAKKKVFFDKYEGYISTQLGPPVALLELKELAEEIKKKS